jgi:hypothetical protein
VIVAIGPAWLSVIEVYSILALARFEIAITALIIAWHAVIYDGGTGHDDHAIQGLPGVFINDMTTWSPLKTLPCLRQQGTHICGSFFACTAKNEPQKKESTTSRAVLSYFSVYRFCALQAQKR